MSQEFRQSRRIRAYPAVALPSRSAAGRGDWEFAIYGDLTDKQSELVGRLVELPRNSRGTIFFDSCGGSAYVGLGLASIIRLRGLDAVAVVAGECSSAAILPFAACRRRFVTPHSTLLFHPVRWQSDEDIRFEEAQEWARHFKSLEEDLDRLLARLFDCDTATIAKWTRPGTFVTGRELAASGLAELVDLFSGDLWNQLEHGRNREPGNLSDEKQP